jgi:hypothetical protein
LADTLTKLDDRDRLQPVSLLNEVVEYRDRGLATVLHRWPKQVPLRAVLLDALAQTQLLLARLDAGVYLAQDAAVCGRAEVTLRELYLRTQDQVRVLEDALALDLLE